MTEKLTSKPESNGRRRRVKPLQGNSDSHKGPRLATGTGSRMVRDQVGGKTSTGGSDRQSRA